MKKKSAYNPLRKSLVLPLKTIKREKAFFSNGMLDIKNLFRITTRQFIFQIKNPFVYQNDRHAEISKGKIKIPCSLLTFQQAPD